MDIIRQIIETCNQITWPGALVLIALIAGICYVLGRFIKSYWGK